MARESERGALSARARSRVRSRRVMSGRPARARARRCDDAISITLAVLIVSSVAFVQEYRSEQSLAALNSLVPPRATALRGGKRGVVEARELVPGDVILVRGGDRVPADCRVLECVELKVDESSLTGEGEPANKTVECDAAAEADAAGPEAAVAECANAVFMGTLVCHGHAKVRRRRRRHGDRVWQGVRRDEGPRAAQDAAADADGRARPHAQHRELRRDRRHRARGARARPALRRRVPDRREPRGRGDPRGPAHLRDGHARARRDAHERAARDRQEAARGRGARLRVGRVRRQDGHAHAERDDRDRALLRRRGRRRARDGRRVHAARSRAVVRRRRG